MDNIFDSLKLVVFDTVATTMGYPATWGSLSARVLFKEPTEDEKLGGVDYSPYAYTVEYKVGDFQGLKESVDKNNSEIITISNKEYFVRKVIAAYDGDCFIAKLALKGT